MAGVLVIGSINMDMTVTTEKIPLPGETVLGTKLEYHGGGKGANQAIAAARAGVNTFMIGAVGKDDNGRQLKKALSESGVDIAGIDEIEEKPTGCAFITIDEKAENSIIVIQGANKSVNTELIHKHKDCFKKADVVLFQHEIPRKTVEDSLIIAKEEGLATILNPAPAFPVKEEYFKYIDYITPNENELQTITGGKKDEYVENAKSLIDKGIKNVIVTLGEKGVIHASSDGVKSYPSIRVKAVDTTGAGDCFNGYFASSLAKGITVEEAIRTAVIASGLSVTKCGAQESIPDIEYVNEYAAK